MTTQLLENFPLVSIAIRSFVILFITLGVALVCRRLGGGDSPYLDAWFLRLSRYSNRDNPVAGMDVAPSSAHEID